jgi:hypothetical protein
MLRSIYFLINYEHSPIQQFRLCILSLSLIQTRQIIEAQSCRRMVVSQLLLFNSEHSHQ